MGQKVNPIGFRIGNVYTWSSRWFARKGDYSKNLLEDYQIRQFLMTNLKSAGVSKVEIERFFDKKTITIHVARPGVAIGRGGAGEKQLKAELVKKYKIKDSGKLEIKFSEVKSPDLDAYLVATNIADQLEKRFPFRRVMYQSLERIKRSGAKGAKISIAGRLGGTEIARRETIKDGAVPLHTIRARIDFVKIDAQIPKAGIVGVKVWIYKGD
ncbi:30S ribosomal protein S3 [Candidatus Curtissbacteria bacterium RIFCSPLOWO2_01_FULL_39_62]|uniref:Small ribosomal subunit protein uS3 n=3 Tax=root TaxID=1 RepID=A0A1F5G7N3_9BACT|nr:30S ribosomal protein S3 [uncultured organism]OGD82910.1 MAG: 30S ribosomal protein S3 [Candidatus Curtissbacteria bacterium RIFCSPHIGHO2_01_FULL_39_57]OGD87825.1 MAG: 30S ribosomal protein S3 [Candidatus Curtissbacteria bacterium RIFCSPHIGHO2_02_FULL_40_16b]OGD90578.1 MAG: 30S ribosomal protein S3 [Candidatus Curtissbacteria bacterium RIFCSPHIGHO2_12_FULL_38_37]OGD99805.1 MAG: 30S ribosomal protein S3 [Candidatus Curtissbacteria bacterium RIFCSPLOWO2_02_FULL_40_11]OGE01088.1 MAG: 30S ribos